MVADGVSKDHCSSVSNPIFSFYNAVLILPSWDMGIDFLWTLVNLCNHDNQQNVINLTLYNFKNQDLTKHSILPGFFLLDQTVCPFGINTMLWGSTGHTKRSHTVFRIKSPGHQWGWQNYLSFLGMTESSDDSSSTLYVFLADIT